MKFSFLGLGSESPSLQLYGKLPVAKDYLRIGCGDGSARELREWLDRTFGTVRDRNEPLTLPEPLRFVGVDDREPLQGCVWPSTDAGGHRAFPFTVLVERRRKALSADLEDGNLSQAEAVWRRLAEARERCLQADDGQALLAEQRGTELDLEDSEVVAGAPADLDAWVASLWPDDRLDGLFDLFRRLAEVARGAHRGPYRLPLVRTLPMRDQVAAWVRVLRRLEAVPKATLPTLFFPSPSLVPSSEPAALVAWAGPLRDDDVEWLTTGDDGVGLGAADLAFGRPRSDDAEALASTDEGAWLRDSLLAVFESFGLRDA